MFCLNCNSFILGETFYKQEIGTAIGSHLSVVIFDLTMQYIENKSILKLGAKCFSGIVYRWFFGVAKRPDIDDILQIANSMCTYNKFK